MRKYITTNELIMSAALQLELNLTRVQSETTFYTYFFIALSVSVK